MIDNKSLKLLKFLKKQDSPVAEENIVSEYSKSLELLVEEELIDQNTENTEVIPFEFGASYKNNYSYNISLKGKAFLEQKFKEGLLKWIPYIVTTLISISALINSILARMRK